MDEYHKSGNFASVASRNVGSWFRRRVGKVDERGGDVRETVDYALSDYSMESHGDLRWVTVKCDVVPRDRICGWWQLTEPRRKDETKGGGGWRGEDMRRGWIGIWRVCRNKENVVKGIIHTMKTDKRTQMQSFDSLYHLINSIVIRLKQN